MYVCVCMCMYVYVCVCMCVCVCVCMCVYVSVGGMAWIHIIPVGTILANAPHTMCCFYCCQSMHAFHILDVMSETMIECTYSMSWVYTETHRYTHSPTDMWPITITGELRHETVQMHAWSNGIRPFLNTIVWAGVPSFVHQTGAGACGNSAITGWHDTHTDTRARTHSLT